MRLQRESLGEKTTGTGSAFLHLWVGFLVVCACLSTQVFHYRPASEVSEDFEGEQYPEGDNDASWHGSHAV